MSTQTSTDLERLRTWLDEHPYHDRDSNPDVYTYGREERDGALRCFAIDLSVSLRYILTDQVWSSEEKLRRIAEAHAEFERNCAEAKALFRAWMTEEEK